MANKREYPMLPHVPDTQREDIERLYHNAYNFIHLKRVKTFLLELETDNDKKLKLSNEKELGTDFNDFYQMCRRKKAIGFTLVLYMHSGRAFYIFDGSKSWPEYVSNTIDSAIHSAIDKAINLPSVSISEYLSELEKDENRSINEANDDAIKEFITKITPNITKGMLRKLKILQSTEEASPLCIWFSPEVVCDSSVECCRNCPVLKEIYRQLVEEVFDEEDSAEFKKYIDGFGLFEPSKKDDDKKELQWAVEELLYAYMKMVQDE